MSEEEFCSLGKIPRIFSYIKNDNYVRTICKLKDDIDYFSLNKFFEMIYTLKIEDFDTRLSNIEIFIKYFYSIFDGKHFINLSNFCYFIGKNKSNVNDALLELLKYFFDMFEVIEESVIDLGNSSDIKLVAMNSDELFYREVESIFYNSKVMDYLSEVTKLKVKRQS